MSNENQFHDYTVTVPQPALGGARYIFTVGDLIPLGVKAANPAWAQGGFLRPSSLTLMYKTGFIQRFEITELRSFMASQSAGTVHPERRQDAIRTYQTAGTNAAGEYEEKTLGIRPDGTHDGLLRKQFYPSQEVGSIAHQQDGLVEMPVTNSYEAFMAQTFLFPNWHQVKTGLATMPRMIEQIKQYFHKRLALVQDPHTGQLTDFPNAELLRKVTLTAIRSCDLYISWGTAAVKAANDAFEAAKLKGVSWSYPEQAEMLFDQLNLQRKDNLVQEQANKLDKLADAMTTLVEVQTQQMAHNQPAKQAVAEVSPAPQYLTVPDESAPLPLGVCSASTRTGERCKGLTPRGADYCAKHKQ